MTVSQEEIRLIQKCWFVLSNHIESIAESFYKELFACYPHYRPYFTADVKTQGSKLMQTVNIIINGIDVWDKLEPEIIKLGEYHARIADFTADDYDNVSEILIKVMCQYKGEKDLPTIQAWQKAFALVSEAMLRGQQSGKARLKSDND